MAADVITRFKLETTQFDSKLRDTAKALHDIASTAQNAGKDFNGFSQKSIEAARALGTVASGATNTKDKLKDLVGSYNDAVKAYDKLSEEAKKGEFGQALAASLQKLQQDIKETKRELYGLGEATKSAGSSLFGDNGLTGMLQVFGGNLLTKGFEMLASGLTDAWSKSIELARAGEGVRIAFERLNQPGLLDKLKEATHGTVSEVELMKQAIKFENFKLPLEDLATYLAFAQQKAKDTGESVDYMVNSITTGLGRQSKQILDNLGISAAELTKRMNEGADMTKAVADIIREEMTKAGDYVETAADRASQAAAKATDELEKFGRSAAPIAEEWGQVWNAISIGAMDFANTLLGPVADSIRSIQSILSEDVDDKIIKMFEAYEKLGNEQQAEANKKKPKIGDVPVYTAPGGYVEVTDTNTGAVIGGKHFDNLDDKNAIKDWRKNLNKKPKSSSSKKTTISDTDKASNYWAKSNANANIFAESFKPEDVLGPSEAWEQYKSVITGCSDSIADFSSETSKWTKNFNPVNEYMEKAAKLAKQQQMAFDAAAQSAINLGSALASIDDPGAKAAGTVIGAIANIALGFGQAVAQAGTMGPWAWLAYVAAGTAALATTISTVHSLTGYAEGGIVKGNSYSGDNVPALVDGSQMVGLNAGEVVLTRAMQSNLAGQLQNGGNRIQVVGRLSGEQLFLCAERWSKRTGKGEFVTWR